MSDINQRIAQLSPAKRAILEQKLKQKAANLKNSQIIPQRSEKVPLPLSFSQGRLWLLDQLEPGNSAYNRPTNIRFSGQLNIAVLEKSLNEIVRRHEILRTNFSNIDGQLVQVIAPSFRLTLPVVELSYLPESEREVEIQRLAIQAAQHSFNLSQLPLIEATLLRLGNEEHILLLTLHHIIFDGWSMGILLKELAALYDAFFIGKPSPLSELSIQYADFAQWQQQRLQGEILESQLAYWKKQLSGNLPILELPTDRPRSSTRTFRGAKESILLPKGLTKSLKALSQREGVTLFMTLLAAFQILLYRYTGQDDIIVGTPIAGRDRTETEKLIGIFINTLVLRTQIDGNLTFQELLGRVREVALGAYTHQDIPFEKLVEELQPNRNFNRTLLFQALFQLRNLPNETLEVQGLKITDCQLETGIAELDITLDITEKPEGLLCLFRYNTDLFDSSTIKRMGTHFQTLLEGIVISPNQRIFDLPILTTAELNQLLFEWNDTQTKYTQNKCIHQLFEEQVEKTPDAVAVVFEDEQLTYRELNDRANQLAHYLQALGVQPEMLVGLCLERSTEMLVGILGILKAGGAYLPLDPVLPSDRLSFILQNAQISLVVSNSSLLINKEFLPNNQKQITAVCLDTDWSLISQKSQENPLSGVSKDNLVYALYTSGSTGKPKGVAVEHRSLLNYVNAIKTRLDILSGASFAIVSTFAADLGNTVIFPSLCTGGCLHIISQERATDPVAFADYCDRHPIDYLKIVPSHLAALLSFSQPEQILPRRCLILGGEAASWTLIEQIQQYLQNCQIFNHYGPTETTVGVTTFKVEKKGECASKFPLHTQTVPLGRPLANIQIYILDSYQKPVPIGVPGELYIGGDSLARGYLNQPQLTKEKFISNPFKLIDTEKADFPERLYKTGDLARYLPDGNIEFLGRIDNQVKIRGFRIELGEIEAVLNQYPSVKETVVIASSDIHGDKRLVAYIVPQPNLNPTALELHYFIKDRLPNYMLPAAITILDALPLTPNGKINRRALPDPNLTLQQPVNTTVSSRDQLELQLTKIWEKVLNLQPIYIDNNFFELGGHSLLAIQLFSQINNVFGKNISLATLFQAPTIAELANILRQEGWSNRWSSLVPIKPEGSKPPIFFHGGAAESMTWANFSRYLPLDQPFYGLQHPILDSKPVTLNSVEEMASLCIKEIQTIQPHGPYFIGGHCFGGTVAFEIAQQLHAQGEKVAFLALIDAYIPKPVSKNNLLIKLQAWFHKLDFFLYKTYYYHADNLKKQNLIGKLIYVYEWLQNKVKFKLKQKSGYKRLKAGLSAAKNSYNHGSPITDQIKTDFSLSNQFIPYEARYLEAKKTNRAAKIDYIPQIYSGRITLFRASKQTLEWYFGAKLGWEYIASEGVEVYEVPGLFGNLFNRSSLPILVEKFNNSLNKIYLDKA